MLLPWLLLEPVPELLLPELLLLPWLLLEPVPELLLPELLLLPWLLLEPVPELLLPELLLLPWLLLEPVLGLLLFWPLLAISPLPLSFEPVVVSLSVELFLSTFGCSNKVSLVLPSAFNPLSTSCLLYIGLSLTLTPFR